MCSVCDTEIDGGGDDGVNLKNCKHVMHFKCLEELFDSGKNECPDCYSSIMEGYESAINPKVKSVPSVPSRPSRTTSKNELPKAAASNAHRTRS